MVMNEREKENNDITSILHQLLNILRVMMDIAIKQAVTFMPWGEGFWSDYVHATSG